MHETVKIIDLMILMQSCDASLLLATVSDVVSEQTSDRSFGMRNFKYVNTIKAAVEKECPFTVSCADIVALSARDAIALVCLTSHLVYICTSIIISLIKFLTKNANKIFLLFS